MLTWQKNELLSLFAYNWTTELHVNTLDQSPPYWHRDNATGNWFSPTHGPVPLCWRMTSAKANRKRRRQRGMHLISTVSKVCIMVRLSKIVRLVILLSAAWLQFYCDILGQLGLYKPTERGLIHIIHIISPPISTNSTTTAVRNHILLEHLASAPFVSLTLLGDSSGQVRGTVPVKFLAPIFTRKSCSGNVSYLKAERWHVDLKWEAELVDSRVHSWSVGKTASVFLLAWLSAAGNLCSVHRRAPSYNLTRRGGGLH